jgi:hypothetical protein
MAWLDSQGNYYEGDRANLSDRGVPTRPSSIHIFVDGEWVEDQVQVAAAQAEVEAVQAQETAKTDMKAFSGWATWTPDQAEAWVHSNVTDLTSAKVAREKMARAIALIRDYVRITR